MNEKDIRKIIIKEKGVVRRVSEVGLKMDKNRSENHVR